MKLPEEIDRALKARTHLAKQLITECVIVDNFLLKNKIEPEDASWLTGVEIYANPDAAEAEVRRAIQEA